MTLPKKAVQCLGDLVYNWEWPDPAIFEDFIALGEEAIPALAELLSPEMLDALVEDEEAEILVYYALQLLSMLGTPAVIPLFLRAYPHVSEDCAQDLEHAIIRLGPESVDPILEFAARESPSWYVLSMAINGAVQQANRDPALRPRVAEGLREILAEYLDEPEPLDFNDMEMVGSLVSYLAEMADPEARPLIAKAFETGRILTAENSDIEMPIISLDEVLDYYEEGGYFRITEPRSFVDQYRIQWRQHLEEEARLKLLEPERPTLTVVMNPRIGRNDPCWCGSGVKYKKCHLPQDEKDKTRL